MDDQPPTYLTMEFWQYFPGNNAAKPFLCTTKVKDATFLRFQYGPTKFKLMAVLRNLISMTSHVTVERWT